MTERIANAPLTVWKAKEAGLKDPYLATFESRLANIARFRNNQGMARVNSNLAIFNPDRQLPAVLWISETKAEILLSNDGAYFEGAHEELCRQNDVEWSILQTHQASLLTVGDKRFIAYDSLPNLLDEDVEKLKEAMQRYSIEGIFSPIYRLNNERIAGMGITNTEGKFGIRWLSMSDYTTVMDCLIKDAWTSQIAELYGLTNTELLRMRLTGELPKNKNKPLQK